MDAERFAGLERLFHQALERDPDERDDWLADACGGDRDLLREVTSLLESHAHPAAILAAPPASWSPDPESRPEAAWIGRQIGPYRLLDLLGEGGSSAVYRAERTDGAYRGVVAIKLLLRPTWTAVALQRFHRECQILANLEHPGIARLRDAGTTAEGVPYLVMDQVDGEPIDRYCRRRRLRVDQRLRLLLKVCSAVGHAHRNLVIHSDIKPANVLVTPGGRPKLLDFGIAMLVDPSPAAAGAETTLTGWRPMTVRYASPEQLRGERLTTASDVYSLGVLLYRLLTGRLPAAAADLPPRRDGRRSPGGPLTPSVACCRGPEPASASASSASPQQIAWECRTRPRKLRRKLAGDLDGIALKALAEDPDRRYRTVEELAGDLRRYLEGRPVSARAASLPERLARLARRNKLAAALVSFLLLAGFGYAVTTTWLLGENVRQRDEAEGQRDRATRVTRFLVELFALADPAKGGASTLTAVELLDLAAERVEVELSGQPETQATLWTVLGEGYGKLGLYERAREPLLRALAIRRRALGEDHPETLASASDLAALLVDLGEFAQADRMLARTLEDQRRVLSGDDSALAESLDRRGVALLRLGRFAAAQALLREALEIRRQALGGDHAEVGSSLHHLAMARAERGDDRAAEALFRESLAITEAAVGRSHPEALPTLKALASLAVGRGDLDGAEALYLEVLAAERKIFGQEHPRVAFSLNHLGHLYLQRGELDRAERFFRDGLAMRRRLLGPDHLAVAVSLSGLASLLSKRGEAEEAERLYGEGLSILRQALSPDSPQLAHILVPLGELLTRQGSLGRAEAVLREAYSLRSYALPLGNPLRARAAGALGACVAALGHRAEAEALLLEGWEGSADAPGEQRRAAEGLVALYRTWGHEERARPYQAFLEQEAGRDGGGPAPVR